MKCLPNIKITEEQLEYVYKQDIFNYGSESKLFKVPSLFGEGTVAKIWQEFEEKDINNKFEKIKRLYQIEELRKINDIQILSSISCRGKIVGYVTNLSKYKEINQTPRTRTETLYYLFLARQKLQQFIDLGILYADINGANILVFKNDICFCDLDNVAYQELKMNVSPICLHFFLSDYGELDEKAISYMYNLFTIKELCFFSENREVEEYFETEQIPRELLPNPYRQIREQMRIVTPQYGGYYFIDYVKDKYKEKVNSLVF